MNLSVSWKRYKTLRLHSVAGCLLALYLVRLPLDVSHLLAKIPGHGLPLWLVSGLMWAMFPIAAGEVAIGAIRWLRWPCPGCDSAFLACGPKIAGRDLLVNPMAQQCRSCGLGKWMDPPAAVPVSRKNLVQFEDLLKLRLVWAHETEGELLKQA